MSPDDADREAAAVETLKRAGLDGLLDRTKADPGAPFEHAEALAGMRSKTPADWARVKELLKKAGVTLADLERAMGAGDANGDGKPGRPVEFEDSEPWDVPVEGAALLDALVALLERYVSLPKGGADAAVR